MLKNLILESPVTSRFTSSPLATLALKHSNVQQLIVGSSAMCQEAEHFLNAKHLAVEEVTHESTEMILTMDNLVKHRNQLRRAYQTLWHDYSDGMMNVLSSVIVLLILESREKSCSPIEALTELNTLSESEWADALEQMHQRANKEKVPALQGYLSMLIKSTTEGGSAYTLVKEIIQKMYELHSPHSLSDNYPTGKKTPLIVITPSSFEQARNYATLCLAYYQQFDATHIMLDKTGLRLCREATVSILDDKSNVSLSILQNGLEEISMPFNSNFYFNLLNSNLNVLGTLMMQFNIKMNQWPNFNLQAFRQFANSLSLSQRFGVYLTNNKTSLKPMRFQNGRAVNDNLRLVPPRPHRSSYQAKEQFSANQGDSPTPSLNLHQSTGLDKGQFDQIMDMLNKTVETLKNQSQKFISVQEQVRALKANIVHHDSVTPKFNLKHADELDWMSKIGDQDIAAEFDQALQENRNRQS